MKTSGHKPVIVLKPIEECIHETAGRVSDMIQDTKFRDVVGILPDVADRLTGLYPWEIRETVAEVFATNKSPFCVEEPFDFEAYKHRMALQLQKSMRAFRAGEGMIEPDDEAADLENCRASVESVFAPKPSYRLSEAEIAELQKEIRL